MAAGNDSPANGYQISKRSGVPRSMVYESLGRLYARGAVLTTGDEKSTLYRPLPPDVLNGVAYDEAGDRLFVTGKHWPTLYEIELVPPGGLAQR